MQKKSKGTWKKYWKGHGEAGATASNGKVDVSRKQDMSMQMQGRLRKGKEEAWQMQGNASQMGSKAKPKTKDTPRQMQGNAMQMQIKGKETY